MYLIPVSYNLNNAAVFGYGTSFAVRKNSAAHLKKTKGDKDIGATNKNDDSDKAKNKI